MDGQTSLLITPDEILAARAAIDPVFLDSALLQHPALDAALGCDCALKVETLNPIRCFKGRGTEALLAAWTAPPAAVIATSAGNFGQGLARAAIRRGVATTILVSAGANPLKVEAMRRLGAEVQAVAPADGDGKARARQIAAETGAFFVEDGAHREIAAGAGTIAQEITAAGLLPDIVVIQVGDGALAAGMGSWLRAKAPATRIIGVVAKGAPAMAQSFAAGTVVETERADTIADGIAIRRPIASSLAQLRACVDEILLVDDAAIVAAARLLLRTAGVVTEPAGAAGVAAIAAYREHFAGHRVATVITGSNLDQAFQARLLAG